MEARRKRIGTANRAQASHAGLLLSRYLSHAVPAKNASEAQKKAHQDDKRQLHRDAMAAAASGQKCYALAYDRWTGSLPRETSAVLPVQGRLSVGLGGDNVLETGLTLHHTYGVPIIPGSALKGLAAHYGDQVWGVADANFKKSGSHHRILFGGTDDSGHIIFHDAWITPDSLRGDGTSGLVLDVMTPHHSDYYSDKTYEAGPKKDELIPPTDFDDPIPVTFLSVAGAFHAAVSCDVSGEAGDRWTKLAFDLLKEALREWGVGGKTSSGYGRFSQIELPGAPENLQSHAAQARPKEPVHGPREKVKVTQRTVDGKLRYEADDGFIGSLLKGTPPDLKDGESTEIWIVRVDKQNRKVPYVFQIDEPPVPKSLQNNPQGGGRNRQRPGGHGR